MTKEMEKAGLTVVHACSIVSISKTVGANRIVPTIAIPHPFGDPAKSLKEEKRLRKKLVEKILQALSTAIDSQTIFD